MRQTNLYQRLSDKQQIIFQAARSSTIDEEFTATMVQEKLSCSYNTAASVLNGLVELNLFRKEKQGKEWLYRMQDKQSIQDIWKS